MSCMIQSINVTCSSMNSLYMYLVFILIQFYFNLIARRVLDVNELAISIISSANFRNVSCGYAINISI